MREYTRQPQAHTHTHAQTWAWAATGAMHCIATPWPTRTHRTARHTSNYEAMRVSGLGPGALRVVASCFRFPNSKQIYLKLDKGQTLRFADAQRECRSRRRRRSPSPPSPPSTSSPGVRVHVFVRAPLRCVALRLSYAVRMQMRCGHRPADGNATKAANAACVQWASAPARTHRARVGFGCSFAVGNDASTRTNHTKPPKLLLNSFILNT